jgi:hypothetical protein
MPMPVDVESFLASAVNIFEKGRTEEVACFEGFGVMMRLTRAIKMVVIASMKSYSC